MVSSGAMLPTSVLDVVKFAMTAIGGAAYGNAIWQRRRKVGGRRVDGRWGCRWSWSRNKHQNTTDPPARVFCACINRCYIYYYYFYYRHYYYHCYTDAIVKMCIVHKAM